MLDEYNAALNDYHDKWKALCAGRTDLEFFKSLRPVAVGWKVSDADEYQKLYAALRDRCDRIVETSMNGRWIAKMHLREEKLAGGIEIFKLMQRRPGSDDALGLDHVDFYSPAVADAERVLELEPDLKWSRESNDAVDDYSWISLWFGGTEAKLKAYTVIDTVVRELQEINARIVGRT